MEWKGIEGVQCGGLIDCNPHLQTASVHTLHLFVQVVFFWVGYNIMVSLQVSSSLDLLRLIFLLFISLFRLL